MADLFFRLSLSRRAQILPALNLLAKTTAEVIPADDLLFGSSFGEEMKKAATLERSGKDIVKTPLAISRKGSQPGKQRAAPSTGLPGNSRALANTKSATKRAGAPRTGRQTYYRSRSRSRKH